MKLSQLNPRWFTEEGSPDIVGVTFDCPCGRCGWRNPDPTRLGVLFVEEIDRDGLPNNIHWTRPGVKWHRTGETFDTLSLTPSIDASGFGHWHGYITGGEIR